MSRRVVYGAELDGSMMRLVGVEGRRVVSYQCIDTRDRGAEVMRSACRRRDVLVSWGSPGSVVRRLPVAVGDVRAAAPAVHDALDGLSDGWGDLPGAGGVWAPDHDDTATVGVVIEPSAAAIRSTLDGTDARLAVAPLVLRHDGLHLSIRRSCAELTLVRDGIAVMSRQLRPGGIPDANPNSHALDDDDATPPQGVSLGGSSPRSTQRRYVAAIARDVARTLEQWGDDMPTEIWVHGEGATLPHVPSFLESVGLTARPAPLDDDIDASAIPKDSRLAAYGALCAALVDRSAHPLISLDGVRTDRGGRRGAINDPYAGFRGVVADAGSRGFATPQSSTRPEGAPTGVGAAIVVSAIAALVAGVAWWRASVGLDEARVHLAAATDTKDAAQVQLDYANEIEVAAAELRRLSPTTSPGWDAAMSTLLSTLPSSPRVDSVLVIVEGDRARAVITVPAAPGVSDDWSNALSAFGPVSVAATGNLLSLTVDLPSMSPVPEAAP